MFVLRFCMKIGMKQNCTKWTRKLLICNNEKEKFSVYTIFTMLQTKSPTPINLNFTENLFLAAVLGCQILRGTFPQGLFFPLLEITYFQFMWQLIQKIVLRKKNMITDFWGSNIVFNFLELCIARHKSN